MSKQKRKTLDSFEDPLGQTYVPGDVVAVSIIDQRSPRTVYGIVENIYPEDTSGEPVIVKCWTYDPELRRGVYHERTACHVQVRVYKRTRWGQEAPEPDGRLYTYKISDNITKVSVSRETLEF